jgi:4-hydroxybenzoate polyprenyltransferase
MLGRVATVWRIVADTAAYRLRKREGGNLVTSVTLGVALSLPVADLGWRLVFGLLLNLWVYLTNDCFDVAIDLRAPGRDSVRTRLLHDNRGAGWAASVALGVLCAALGALHSLGLLVAFGTTAAIIVAYSSVLKRWPIVDLMAMTAWGLSMALVGFPLGSAVGWKFAGLLGLLCTATQAVQITRDHESDRDSGLRTTAVVLGPTATRWIARVMVGASAVYAFVLLHWMVAPALLGAAGVPFSGRRAERAWDVFRLVFGLCWLAMLGAYWRTGTLHGWVGAP